MSRSTRLVLTTLLWALVLIAAGISVAGSVRRLQSAQADVEASTVRLQAAGADVVAGLQVRQAEVRARIAELEARLYAPEEITPYAFASVVTEMLEEIGIDITSTRSYRTEEGTEFEFAGMGSPMACAELLHRVAIREKYWRISSISVRSAATGAGMRLSMTIAYVQNS